MMETAYLLCLAGILSGLGNPPAGLLEARVVSSPRDTVVDLRKGDNLVLSDMEGLVVVSAWDRSSLKAEVESKGLLALRVRRSGSRLELRLDGANREEKARLRITVPPWINLSVSGQKVDAEIGELTGNVVVRSLQGDMLLRNLAGSVEAYAVEGRIEATGLSGSARLRTGDDDIRISGSTAALELETLEGDVRLDGVRSPRMRVQTTNGDIDFNGPALAGGDYGFFSHSGDIRLRLEPPVNLEAEILSYDGEFRSDFPVRAGGFRSGERLRFVLGTGGPRLVAETFDGEIRLLEASGSGSL